MTQQKRPLMSLSRLSRMYRGQRVKSQEAWEYN